MPQNEKKTWLTCCFFLKVNQTFCNVSKFICISINQEFFLVFVEIVIFPEKWPFCPFWVFSNFLFWRINWFQRNCVLWYRYIWIKNRAKFHGWLSLLVALMSKKTFFQLKSWSLSGNGSYSEYKSNSHEIAIETAMCMCRIGSWMIFTYLF